MRYSYMWLKRYALLTIFLVLLRFIREIFVISSQYYSVPREVLIADDLESSITVGRKLESNKLSPYARELIGGRSRCDAKLMQHFEIDDCN